MAKQNKKSSKKKRSTLFGTAIVVLGILILTLVFLTKKDQILTNLKETNFFERVTGSTPEFVEKHESTINEKTEKSNPIKDEIITLKNEVEKKTEEIKKPETKDIIIQEEKEQPKVEEKKETPKTEQKEVQKKEPEKKQEVKVVNTDLHLCFIEIDSDGSVVRKMVKRSVPKNDSPLSTALNLLLKGPDTKNTSERNAMTLIPAGTKLLSAKVQNGVAYLNFNDAFEFNSYGVEGYIGQLMQIVFTATEFSTVNSVQFLIDGEKREYLGSEGQWIGSPLSRSNF